MKEALVYKKFQDNSVRCLTCQRECHISENNVGFCLTKLNQKRKLCALNYGLIQGIQVDPIEKKPFYHFLPGEMVPSIGSYGCNFHCKQCLNWWCSWGTPASSILKEAAEGKKQVFTSPEDLIEEIKNMGYRGIAFTYNEPTVWAEYVLDVAKLAKKKRLFTVYVTNGSWSKETLDKIGPYLDAANVDLKGFSENTYARMGAFWGKIPEMLVYSQKKHHIFIEITTLLISGINDTPKELKNLTQWIVKNLGPETPWHLSQFDPTAAPDLEFQKIPFTTPEQLENAAKIGQEEGLKHIYIWAPASNYSQADTICPKCETMTISRRGYQVQLLGVDNKGLCVKCGYNLNIKCKL